MAPFGPFAEDDHLTQLIKSYMNLAHLPILKKRRGMHSLRHTMASLLLEKIRHFLLFQIFLATWIPIPQRFI